MSTLRTSAYAAAVLIATTLSLSGCDKRAGDTTTASPGSTPGGTTSGAPSKPATPPASPASPAK
jgi:hypothetical protein